MTTTYIRHSKKRLSRNLSVEEGERNVSFWEFLQTEILRTYDHENDEESSTAKMDVYYLIKIPLEVEKFILFGFLQCAYCFLFVYTFFPIRFAHALCRVLTRPFQFFWGTEYFLNSVQICDLLKGFILCICCYLMSYIDPSILYHLIKSQSVIKLIVFYNMLEVGDKMLSSIGTDVINGLFWNSTEPRSRKKEYLDTVFHFLFAVIYLFFHALLVLFQATTLNVAINSGNKALLTIIMSNNFAELKSSVFKKFDKKTLFPVTCYDSRERFHHTILLFTVVLLTMEQYAWNEEIFWNLCPYCYTLILAEMVVDWTKHICIIRFNKLSIGLYKDYILSLAYDTAQTRQKNTFLDHSDLIARRMELIPLPLGVVMVRVFWSCFRISKLSSLVVAVLIYATVYSLFIVITLLILWQSYNLIDRHQQEREKEEKVSSDGKDICTCLTLPVLSQTNSTAESSSKTSTTITSVPERAEEKKSVKMLSTTDHLGQLSNLTATAIFANSTVSMNEVCLNEEMLRNNVKTLNSLGEDEMMSRSQPNIVVTSDCSTQQSLSNEQDLTELKRSESEPSMTALQETVSE